MTDFPCLVRSAVRSGEARYRLGDPLVDRYLEFVAGRARPNTLRAVAFDLKAFFTVVAKDPVAVSAADVFEFLADQRGDRTVVRLADRESGLSARTIARRLSSVSGLYAYLVARGDTPVQVNPVPRGLSTRRQGGSRTSRTVPLVRVAEEEAEKRRRPLLRDRDGTVWPNPLNPDLPSAAPQGRPAPPRTVQESRIVPAPGGRGIPRMMSVRGRRVAAAAAGAPSARLRSQGRPGGSFCRGSARPDAAPARLPAH
jgi:integrase/recombinase XerD